MQGNACLIRFLVCFSMLLRRIPKNREVNLPKKPPLNKIQISICLIYCALSLFFAFAGAAVCTWITTRSAPLWQLPTSRKRIYDKSPNKFERVRLVCRPQQNEQNPTLPQRSWMWLWVGGQNQTIRSVK